MGPREHAACPPCPGLSSKLQGSHGPASVSVEGLGHHSRDVPSAPACPNGSRAPPVSHRQPCHLARVSTGHVPSHGVWPVGADRRPHTLPAHSSSVCPPTGTVHRRLPGLVAAGLAEHVQWNPQLSQKLISKLQVAGIPEVNSEKQPTVHRAPYGVTSGGQGTAALLSIPRGVGADQSPGSHGPTVSL